MQLRLRTLSLRIDWLMLLFPACALLLGEGESAAMLLASLGVHECAHWAAATALRLHMTSVRLTPFGGFAQIENPYGVPPLRLCAVAAAGPAANLLLILLSTALCRWSLLPPDMTAGMIRVNAVLMLFNLTPALPLDGGRILFAMLSARIRESCALNICLWSGRIVSGLLIATAAAGFAASGRLNLSFLFSAAFILASAPDERRALTGSRMRSMLNRTKPITVPVPADLIVIDAATSPQLALRAAHPARAALFAVYKNGVLTGLTDDRTLIRRVLESESEAGGRRHS